jgi:hypothetical protein
MPVRNSQAMMLFHQPDFTLSISSMHLFIRINNPCLANSGLACNENSGASAI